MSRTVTTSYFSLLGCEINPPPVCFLSRLSGVGNVRTLQALEVTLEENECIIIFVYTEKNVRMPTLSHFSFPREQPEAGEHRAVAKRRRLGHLGVQRGSCVRANRRWRPPAVRGAACDCIGTPLRHPSESELEGCQYFGQHSRRATVLNMSVNVFKNVIV